MADLSPVIASVAAGSGVTLRTGTAGETIIAGDSLYIDLTDGNKMRRTAATAAASSVFAGIAVCSAATGQPVVYYGDGQITIGCVVALGIIYCVSPSAGKICPSADLVPGNYVTIIGMPSTTLLLYMSPRISGIAKA